MPHTIDREAVRLLAIQIGNKEAAKQLGLSYDRVRQWACRYKWKQIQKTPQQPSVTVVTKPSDVLGKLGEETKLSLAKSVNRMAKDAETANLRHAPYVHKTAQTAAIVHGWNETENKGNTILNLGVLIGETTLKDAPKTVLEHGAAD